MTVKRLKSLWWTKEDESSSALTSGPLSTSSRASAAVIAGFLAAHPKVAEVSYPLLAGSPDEALARRQMSAGSGLVSFELTGGTAAGRDFVRALEMVHCAVSLGDAETLVQHPASMTHSTYSSEERARYGITDGLIRLSIGLENSEDILEDIERALETV